MNKLFFTLTIVASLNSKAESLHSLTYRWDGMHSDASSWTEYSAQSINDHIGGAPSANDVTSFCPKYNSLSDHQQLQFWIYLISSMAQLESSFKPEDKYTEDFVDSSGKKVVSRGLLQLSHESAKLYNCAIKKEMDLHDAEINLDCGVRIIAHWLKKDHVITGKSNGQWLGIARYWSIFRYKTEKIKGWTKSISICK